MHTSLRPLVIAALGAGTALALDIGDRAPPLDGVAVWLNGDAVQPSKPDGKTRYVVELWATWCGPCRVTAPHLNELHAEFKDRGVVIVGLTDEDEAKVRPFVESLKLNYRIAIDPKRTSTEAWFRDVEGIPHAFVVDTNGVIVWAGHPMDGLRDVLAELVQGGYSPARRQQRDQQQELLAGALQAQDFPKALGIVDQMLREEPRRMELHHLRMGLLAQTGDLDGVRQHQRRLLEVFADAPRELNDLAWTLAAPSPLPLEMRDAEVAIRAARRAVELTGGRDASILDTLAIVLQFSGLTDAAIEVEERALEVAGDPETKAEVRKNLEFLRRVRAARSQAEAARAAALDTLTNRPAASEGPVSGER
ncbi:MAG: redoxin domain-containing protein [Kiritimatiellae bacterium]|nr:redoxin domain-containing protein [Kiritimatiellia bacterium]